MGIAQSHALGRTMRGYAVAEATAGTQEKPTSADAFKFLAFNIAYNQARKDRMDWRQTRSLLERITDKASVTWDVEAYLLPSGTAGTPPDLHPAIYAALGGYTNTPATSDAYSLSDAQALRTLTLARESESVFMEALWGGFVEEIGFAISGGDNPKVKMSGFGMGYALTGTGTLNGAMAASTTMVVQAADEANFHVGSIVKIGTDDNSGAGFKVTAKNGATMTIDAAATANNGDAVIPFVPTETTAGSPIPVTAGSITIDAASYDVTALEITIKNNIKAIEDEAFATIATDGIPGFREVTGKVSLRARKDMILELGKRQNFAARDLIVVCGDTAGQFVTFSLPTIEVEFAAPSFSGPDEGMIELPFRALGSAGADEVSITFT